MNQYLRDPSGRFILGNPEIKYGAAAGKLLKNLPKEGMLAKLGKGAKKLRGGAAAPWATLIGLMLLMNTLKTSAEDDVGKFQTELMEKQAGAVSPESMMYQAMMPNLQQEEQDTRRSLVNQMLGGTTGPSLARGESIT